MTCHDGFTLNDLFSYNQKHNEANGENNRDGSNDNWSWNCGVEGPVDDSEIEELRNRQVKNVLAATALSAALPMILMGDETRRTQRGDNNAYCLDDETSWLDLSLVTKHADILRFVQLLLARRVLREGQTDVQRMGLEQLLREAKLALHGVKLGQPDWSNSSHSLALGVEIQSQRLRYHLIVNACWEALDCELPLVSNSEGGAWRRRIDTALDPPRDIVEWQRAPPVPGRTYRAGPRSVVILLIGDNCRPPETSVRQEPMGV